MQVRNLIGELGSEEIFGKTFITNDSDIINDSIPSSCPCVPVKLNRQSDL